jgi:hypothetical protein
MENKKTIENQHVIEWLDRARNLNIEQNYIKRNLEKWESLASKATSNPSEPLGAGGGRSMEHFSIKLRDARYQLKEIERVYDDIYAEILGVIKCVETERFRDVLMQRYIKFRRFSEIAGFRYGDKYIFRLHRKAVRVVRWILEYTKTAI